MLISLKALIKSTMQLLETNNPGLKYKSNNNNNTMDKNWTHNFLLNFLKSVTASASSLGRSTRTCTHTLTLSLSLPPPPYI